MNHQFLFVSNILGETINKFTSKTIFQTSKWNALADRVEKLLFLTMPIVGILRWSGDIEKAVTGRSKLIWEEARKRNIEMQQAIMFGKPIELYRANIHGKNHFFPSIPIPPHLPQAGYSWLDDKLRLSEELRTAGIPSPRSILVPIFGDNAKIILRELSTPIIVKPKDGSRGRHTTTNIRTEQEFKRALTLGRKISLFLLAQEHLMGSVYRATVVDGKLVGFFRADSPQVMGDGVKNIRELIEEKNKILHERLSPMIVNDDLLSFIERQGYDLESIPGKKMQVNLSAKTGRMYGGYTKEMLPEVHSKMHTIFEKVAKVVNVPVAGFDLIIENPSEDPDSQRWGIIECNSLPFIDLHCFPLEGNPINVAKHVWDLWDKQK